MTKTVIKLEDISLHFPKQRNPLSIILDFIKKNDRKFTALKDVNIEIKQGEVVGFMGWNGSGKSTLLRVVSGIYPPDFGEVHATVISHSDKSKGPALAGHQTGQKRLVVLGQSSDTMRMKCEKN